MQWWRAVLAGALPHTTRLGCKHAAAGRQACDGRPIAGCRLPPDTRFKYARGGGDVLLLAPYLLLPGPGGHCTSIRPSISRRRRRERSSPGRCTCTRASRQRAVTTTTLLFSVQRDPWTLGSVFKTACLPGSDPVLLFLLIVDACTIVPTGNSSPADFWHSVFGLEWVPMRCELIEDRCSSIVRAITRVYTVLRVVIITRETVGTGRLPLGDR